YQTDLKQSGQQDKTIQLYEELLEDNPHNTKAIFGYSLFLRDIGQPRRSTRVLTEQTADISQNDLIRSIFRSYLEPEQYRNAAYLLQRLIAQRPDFNDLHYLLGLSYDGLKEHGRALAQFRAVPPPSRFYRQATIQIAFRHAEDNRNDLAIAYLEKALAQDPENTEFMTYLGSFYEEAERYEDAERYLLKAIEKDPDNERAHFRLGVIYDKMKRKEASIEIMKRVIELNPDHANALNYLGYTYADMGIHLDEAEALVRKALALRPDDGYITDSLGWVFYQKGQYAEALTWLLKASELELNDPIINEHVGDAYLKLNNKAKALEYYRKSLSLRTEDSEREKIRPKIDALTTNKP
ncbi:MAG: tetratricopeptide repeat protein, partial [Desulfosarcina sp.]|nr:tetratricopeptide repeat protein [Desulfobacterales bacterium]